ncbi:MAG TPA: GAF domain-containing protein [Anaerolineae bacterium]|nr:GAF domain-containing protein [Anaerolineae bacterium]HQK15127.1 GAF domain-containing protein [Anaerolineae bacterium]
MFSNIFASRTVLAMAQSENKPKILYIDDAPASRRLVQRLLFAHYEFFEAPDGLSGIDKAVEVQPDLILVDLNLPQFTGYEVATRLKSLFPHVPVVALTADMTEHVREHALASGCDGYIAKPIDADTFVEQIAHFLGGRREILEDDSFRDAYQQTLVVRMEEKVRELTQALKSNAELNTQRDQLLKEVQRRARLLEAGARVSQTITSILHLDTLLQTTVQVIGEEFGFHYVGIFLVDETGEWLVLRAESGPSGTQMAAEGYRLKVGSLTMVGAATGRRQPFLAQDMEAETLPLLDTRLPLTRSAMALPLIMGDNLVGALTVQSIVENAFDQDAVRALQAVADQLATAIGNARLYDENQKLLAQAERRARLLEATAQVGRVITSILNTDALLKKTVDILCNVYGFSYAGIFLVDATGDWAVLRAGHGEAGAEPITEGHKLKVGGLSMVGMSIAERKPLIASDIGEEPLQLESPHLSLTRSEMALPLIVGDKVIGAVSVQSREEAVFTAEDMTTLQAMADQLAIAIDNARLLHDLETTHAELVRTKTFEAIATATGEAIHWVGNKAAPIPGSVARVREDVTRYLLMANALLDEAPAGLREHKFAQMLTLAVESLTGLAAGLDLSEIREELAQQPLKRLQRMLSVASIFEDLTIIEQSARAILNIKEDLIGPARQKRLEPVFLPDLLRETVRSMGIPQEVVRFLLVEDVKPVLADPDQLAHVFINLIKNAMEAMYKVEDKKLFIWVRTADDPRFVVTDVTDNGEGIPPEMIDKIWVAFYTTKGDRGGTGLGLPACAKIVNQLGGKILVESVIGEGTTFSVYLPVMQA